MLLSKVWTKMVKGKSEVCHVRPVGPFRFRPDICWSMFLEQCRSRFGEAARPTFVVVHTPASYANGSGTQTQLNQPCELVHAFVDSQKSRTRQTSCLGHCSTQVKVPPTLAQRTLYRLCSLCSQASGCCWGSGSIKVLGGNMWNMRV